MMDRAAALAEFFLGDCAYLTKSDLLDAVRIRFRNISKDEFTRGFMIAEELSVADNLTDTHGAIDFRRVPDCRKQPIF